MFDAIDPRWWRFLHILGVFLFLLAHGVSVFVLFRVRKERDREKIRELLTLSGSTVTMLYASLGLIVLAGVIAVLASPVYEFEQLWISASIGILILTIGAMLGMARPYYKQIKEAVALRPSGVPRVSDEDLAARLTSARPTTVAVIGFVGLVAILYLMVFKPGF